MRRHIHDVVVIGTASEHTDSLRLVLRHVLYLAHGEQPRHVRLAGTTSPPLSQHRRWNDRRYLLGQEAGMQCRHPPVVSFGGDQRHRCRM
jgi:hypothetical protein